MICHIYAVKDTIAGNFMPPFLQPNNAVAFREFGNIVNHGDSIVSLNYVDMDLYCIGDYDTDTGCLITAEGHPFLICHGSDVKEVTPDEK